jgi:hypothetical protein
MYCWQKFDPRSLLPVKGMRIHYNFLRGSQVIGGQTPAEAAGMNLNLGENKTENLMGLVAARKRDASRAIGAGSESE